MAGQGLTRAQIKARVQAYTGKTSLDTRIEYFCDDALLEALNRHAFVDAWVNSTATSGSEDDVIFALPTNTIDVLAASIKDSDDNYTELELKSRRWFMREVGSASTNSAGRPKYASHFSGALYLERPLDASYTLDLWYTAPLTFASDSSVNPIAVLDTFIVDYCTAQVFLSVEDQANYAAWWKKAVGYPEWSGGSFKSAVEADTREPARTVKAGYGDSAIARPVFFDDSGTAWYRS